MLYTRRNILKKSGVLGLSAGAATSGIWTPAESFGQSVKPLFPDAYPDIKEIIQAAIDSAITAGASYADARLTHREELGVGVRAPSRTENMAFGVRVLYQGYWGFSSSPVWSREEGARMGRAAVDQARSNVLGREHATELAPIDATNGHWETPVKDDPFSIHYDELADFFNGLRDYIITLKFVSNLYSSFNFSRIHKAFGSSLNQFNTQTLYSSGGVLAMGLTDNKERTAGAEIEEITPAGYGFEYFRDRPLRDYISIAHEEALRDLELPVKPIDAGRYSVLADQNGVGKFLINSVGSATEVDRVFGFESNAGGTSYIDDPLSMLNTLKIGTPLLNVVCDRSEAGSVGRVKWDDEGVMPVKYDLVKNGVLVNLQTTREGASWIKEHYGKTGQEYRSSGSASAPTALDVQLAHKADMYLTPGNTSTTRDDLRAEMGEGIELRMPSVTFDFQQITGLSRADRTYEIRKGNRVARFTDSGMLFRTPELWSNMVKVGGKDSVKYYGLEARKGQPEQLVNSAVYAPPAVFKEMIFIDVKRKA